MKNPLQPAPPVPDTALRCWNWLTPEDAIRHALAAFYAACRIHEAEDASGFLPHARRSTLWAQDVVDLFAGRLNGQAEAAGLPGLEINTWAKLLDDYDSRIERPLLKTDCRASHNENPS